MFFKKKMWAILRNFLIFLKKLLTKREKSLKKGVENEDEVYGFLTFYCISMQNISIKK